MAMARLTNKSIKQRDEVKSVKASETLPWRSKEMEINKNGVGKSQLIQNN